METYQAMNKIKPGKVPGVCGIYPEYIRHSGNDALHRIFTWVWEEEMVPEVWHQEDTIILLHKGKGSKSECCNIHSSHSVLIVVSLHNCSIAHAAPLLL